MITVADLLADGAMGGQLMTPNPVCETDALQEAQILDVRFDVMFASVAVLFELRTALQIDDFDAGLLVAREVRDLHWTGERRGPWRTAWVVGGSDVDVDSSSFAISMGLFPYGTLDIRAESACFYAGRVPSLADRMPSYGDDSEEFIRANLPNWSSPLENVSIAHTPGWPRTEAQAD